MFLLTNLRRLGVYHFFRTTINLFTLILIQRHFIFRISFFNTLSCSKRATTKFWNFFSTNEFDEFWNQVVSAQSTQNKCQENKIRNLGLKIVEEMEDHEDDVFFAAGSDIVDVDSSIPGLALAFMKWISEEWDFEYLLLTEDISFVNINKVFKSWRSNVDQFWENIHFSFSIHRSSLFT